MNQSGGFLVASYGLVLNSTSGLGLGFFQAQVTGPSDVAHFNNFLNIYSLFELLKAKAIFCFFKAQTHSLGFLCSGSLRQLFMAQARQLSFSLLRLKPKN